MKIIIAVCLTLLSNAYFVDVRGSNITWSSPFTYVNTNNIAIDTFAQLIGGDVVDARYTSLTDSVSQITRVVDDTLNSRLISFRYLSLNQSGGIYGGNITSTGNAELDQVLSNGYQGGGGQGSLLITLTNLVVGQEYTMQLFSRTSYGYWINNTKLPLELQVFNAPPLDSSSNPDFDFVGPDIAPQAGEFYPSWFTTGVFTADSTTETLALYSAVRSQPNPETWGNPQFDAYILTIPEPSTYALLLLSGAASLWALRRRKS